MTSIVKIAKAYFIDADRKLRLCQRDEELLPTEQQVPQDSCPCQLFLCSKISRIEYLGIEIFCGVDTLGFVTSKEH